MKIANASLALNSLRLMLRRPNDHLGQSRSACSSCDRNASWEAPGESSMAAQFIRAGYAVVAHTT